jgi:hypothetical protein
MLNEEKSSYTAVSIFIGPPWKTSIDMLLAGSYIQTNYSKK